MRRSGTTASTLVFLTVLALLCRGISATCSGKDASCVEFAIGKELEVKDHALEGHVIRVVNTSTDVTCLFQCLIDCRCTSYNEDTQKQKCELNSETNYSAPASLVQKRGIKYQNFRVSTKISNGKISTDCCLGRPCLNGGVCEELCDHPYKRINCTCAKGFSGSFCQFKLGEQCSKQPCKNNGTCVDHVTSHQCECRPGFIGKNCEQDASPCSSNPCPGNFECKETGVDSFDCSSCKPSYYGPSCGQRALSCMDILSADSQITDDWFTLADADGNLYKTYCVFLRTLQVVYTLAMSHTFTVRNVYKTKPLTVNYPRNESSPNFYDFRLSREKMVHLQTRPKYISWVFSCRFDKSGLNFYNDFIIVEHTTIDILAFTGQRCVEASFGYVRGTNVGHKQVYGVQQANKTFHLQSGACDLPVQSATMHYFGYYVTYDPSFRCSKSDDSTTQLWFRESI